MKTCHECNRFLGDTGHALTCSKRGLSPVASDPLLADLEFRDRLTEIMDWLIMGPGRGRCPQTIYGSAHAIRNKINEANARADGSAVDDTVRRDVGLSGKEQ